MQCSVEGQVEKVEGDDGDVQDHASKSLGFGFLGFRV